MKKYFVILLTSIIMFSFTFNNNLSYANTEMGIESQLEDKLTETAKDGGLEVEELNVQIENGKVDMTLSADDYTAEIQVDTNLTNLSSSNENMKYTVETEDGLEEYSMFFGTLDEKKAMDAALEADSKMLESLEENVPLEESITIQGNSLTLNLLLKILRKIKKKVIIPYKVRY